MKKRAIIIPATLLAIAAPATVITAKHLDTSSTAPVIKSTAENWSKTASVSIATAASFGGSDLDHYEYCISDTDNFNDCEWKNSSVETVRVRNLGISYIWMRGVSKYGVVSDISDFVLTRVDRNKPEASFENEVTTSSITVTVSATDDSGIKSYEYSIDNSEYIVDGNSHAFSNLASGTTYNIKVRITDLADNTKILNFTQSTSSPVVARTTRAVNGINFSNLPNGAFNKDQFSGKSPSRGGKGERPSNNKTDSQEEIPDPSELPEQSEELEELEQPEEPEEPEQPEEPQELEQPDCLEETELPEQPEDTEEEAEESGQSNLSLCHKQPEQSEQPSLPENPEQQEEVMQPQEPETEDSASNNEEPIVNEPENNSSADAIENSEPIEENDTILDQLGPSENTSTIENIEEV